MEKIKITGGYQGNGGGSFKIDLGDGVYSVWSNERNISHFRPGEDGYVIIDVLEVLEVKDPDLRKKLVALVWPMVDQI
jgi:hypothetical protein